MFESFLLGALSSVLILWVIVVGAVLLAGPVFGPMLSIGGFFSAFVAYERFHRNGRFKR